MIIRRISMDVDKATKSPTIFELAAAIQKVHGVEAANITVSGIDMETVGMDITVEGNGFDHEKLIAAIESTGAVVHSVDQLIIGDRIIDYVKRQR